MARKRTKTTRPRVTHVEASGEPHPEPDWDKFAWALLQYVRSRREAKLKRPSKSVRKQK
jgi:hypothetical protein